MRSLTISEIFSQAWLPGVPPFTESVVYAPVDVEVGTLFWELPAATVSRVVVHALECMEAVIQFGFFSFEMTPDLELSAKEVLNLKIQWRGRRPSPAEYTHPTGTGKVNSLMTSAECPRALLGD